MESDRLFGWVEFYREFADRLLEHKSDRRQLVARVREVCNNLGLGYLDRVAMADPSTGLPDICPFTTMGTFNRGISTANRKTIASELAQFLGVTQQVPDAFGGIPTLDNQNSVVFWNLRDVGPLWHLFEDAIRLADTGSENSRLSFLESYSRVFEGKGIGRKLTIGLFWARPERFLSLDSRSEGYIKDTLRIPLSRRMPIPGSKYLELVDRLEQRFREPDSPIHSFYELAWGAYEPAEPRANSAVWLVRAGRKGEFEDAVFRHGLAIVDWGAPDLTGAVDKDAVEELVRRADPTAKDGSIRIAAGQLSSFLLQMREGDIVVLPLKAQHSLVALGRITGPYKYREVEGYWYHTREVKWIRRDVNRSDFGEELKGFLGGRTTIARLKSNEGERRVATLLEGIKGAATADGPQRQATAAYTEPSFETIRSSIEAEGLVIDDRTLRRFHLSLRSRGFVILSGISGTGKTWLAQAYARAVGGCELLVPVAPNWTTNEDLLGYLNPISGVYHDTEFSNFLREAALEWDSAVAEEREPIPNFLILDEMNLARVEYYFATFLSKIEVRQRQGTADVQLGEEAVQLTPNLKFVGTVNVDETTHGFADKVYDRAQLVELEAPREAILRHLGDSPLAEPLLSAWEALQEVAPFAFRVIDDIKAYVEGAEALGVVTEEALDEQMLQKLLPKIHGIDPRIEQSLTRFIELCADRFPLSAEKAGNMRTRFNDHGSASYFA